MNQYEDTITMFLTQAQSLGVEIHTDYQKAKQIFEAIEKDVNFDSLISRIASENLLKECQSFGSTLLKWNDTYPKILNDYRQILNIVIEDLKKINGIIITESDSKISITFDSKEFIYHFNENVMLEGPNVKVSDNSKNLIALEENKIVQEISDILSLDKYIKGLLEHIKLINNTYNIQAAAYRLQSMMKVDSPELIVDLRATASWWADLRKTLDKLKSITKTAVEMDEKVTKELEKLFSQEKREQTRDAKLRAAKAGMSLLSSIALNFIPGGSAISAAVEIYKERKVYKEALEVLSK
jgi:hypothetical protein